MISLVVGWSNCLVRKGYVREQIFFDRATIIRTKLNYVFQQQIFHAKFVDFISISEPISSSALDHREWRPIGRKKIAGRASRQGPPPRHPFSFPCGDQQSRGRASRQICFPAHHEWSNYSEAQLGQSLMTSGCQMARPAQPIPAPRVKRAMPY